jgi:hypothetical protein
MNYRTLVDARAFSGGAVGIIDPPTPLGPQLGAGGNAGQKWRPREARAAVQQQQQQQIQPKKADPNPRRKTNRPPWPPHRRTMSKAITKECMALLKEASEMFDETGRVPGIDGEQVPAETIVPDAKAYISEVYR